MNSSSSTSKTNERVICLIDMDCFYVQVEEVAAPEFRGKPCGVSQYNPYKGGGLIAVNYEARKYGVKRGMRGEEAKALCPDFHTFFVQEKRGKADLSKYREASSKIFDILGKNFRNVEKASIDEAYVDLTEQVLELDADDVVKTVELVDSYVLGTYYDTVTAAGQQQQDKDQEANLKAWLETVNKSECSLSADRLLALGALLVQRTRQEIFSTLGFHCSAGIAHNKTLAKLCAGLNKPNKQTILPFGAVQCLYQRTPINKIKNLGGKLGMMLTEGLELNTMADLAKKSLAELSSIFGEKTGNWLHQISQGIDTEPVLSRRVVKSIGCSKNFRGNQVLNTHSKVEYWVRNLCEELEERLESDKALNQRDATLLVVQLNNEAGAFSKSITLASNAGYCSKKLASHTIEVLQGFNKSKIKDQWHPVIYTIGLSATKFVSKEKAANSIQKYFNKQTENTDQKKKDSTDDMSAISRDYEVEEKKTAATCKKGEEVKVKAATEKNEKEAKNQATKTFNRIDIKALLAKQAEKAANALPKSTCTQAQTSSSCSKKERNVDLKSMLLKQAEKAVIVKSGLMAETTETTASNKENANEVISKSKKRNDLKNMLIRQAEKSKAQTTRKERKEEDRAQFPPVITLNDSSDEDDYATIKANLSARLSKSSAKVETDKIAVKRRSIDITPIKTIAKRVKKHN